MYCVSLISTTFLFWPESNKIMYLTRIKDIWEYDDILEIYQADLSCYVLEPFALHESVREWIWLQSITDHIQGTCGLKIIRKIHTCIFEDNAAYIEQVKVGFIKDNNTNYISPVLLQ